MTSITFNFFLRQNRIISSKCDKPGSKHIANFHECTFLHASKRLIAYHLATLQQGRTLSTVVSTISKHIRKKYSKLQDQAVQAGYFCMNFKWSE